MPIIDWAKEEGLAEKEISERVKNESDIFMKNKIEKYGPEVWNMVEKNLTLQVLDQHWKDHLLGLDHLRQGIGLRAYGQKDPLNEYKQEAFLMFEEMMRQIRFNVSRIISFIEIKTNINENQDENRNIPEERPRIPRNARCPLCDSGKKYKHCCGKLK